MHQHRTDRRDLTQTRAAWPDQKGTDQKGTDQKGTDQKGTDHADVTARPATTIPIDRAATPERIARVRRRRKILEEVLRQERGGDWA